MQPIKTVQPMQPIRTVQPMQTIKTFKTVDITYRTGSTGMRRIRNNPDKGPQSVYIFGAAIKGQVP